MNKIFYQRNQSHFDLKYCLGLTMSPENVFYYLINGKIYKKRGEIEKRVGIGRGGVRVKQQVGLDLGESVCSFDLFSLDIFLLFFFFFLSFHCKRIL